VVQPRAEDGDAGGDQLRVGAEVAQQLDPRGEQLALLGRGHLHVLGDVAAVDGGEVALGALLDPLHRHAEPLGDRDRDRFLGVEVQLGAEAAADVRRDHPDLGLVDPGDQGHQGLEDVGDLGGGVEGELALGGDRRHHHATRLDRVGDQARVVVALLHHHRCLVEDPVHVAVLEPPGVHPVGAEALVEERGAVGERLLGAGDDRQLLVVDLDRFGRVLGAAAAVGHHHGDDLTGVADPVLRHRPVVGDAGVGGGLVGQHPVGDRPGTGHADRPLRGEVLAGVGGDDAGHLERARDVDPGQVGVGDRAAHEVHPQHPGQGDVVDEAALAGEQLWVLLAEHPAADVLLGGLRVCYLGHADPPCTSAGWRMVDAASWIASTMFW
jgi:hypothetical protein